MATQSVERSGTSSAKPETDTGGGKHRDFIGSNPLTPYLFLAPYLALFFVFVLGPAVYGFYISLFEWDYMLPNKPFVGFENYGDLFDPESLAYGNFWQSMEATGKFTLYSVPPLVLIPLGIALILNERFPGRGFFRAIYFAPFALGIAVVGLIGQFMFDPNIGVINNYLRQLGFSNFPWTTDVPWVWVTLVAVTVWWTLGFNAVIYLAGLQDITPDLYDAAKVDGASGWQRFRHVTVPGLRPVLLFVVTITILASANMFGQSYLITEGRPGNETRTAIMYIANEGLQQFKMGNAAAMSYFLALLLALISIFNFVFFRQREE